MTVIVLACIGFPASLPLMHTVERPSIEYIRFLVWVIDGPVAAQQLLCSLGMSCPSEASMHWRFMTLSPCSPAHLHHVVPRGCFVHVHTQA